MQWLKVLSAIALVENSTGDPNAISSAGALGPMQIKPCVLQDVNRWYQTQYTVEDLRDLKKSKHIALKYILYWRNYHYFQCKQELSVEDLVKIYHLGYHGWLKDSTKANAYWQKVRENYEFTSINNR